MTYETEIRKYLVNPNWFNLGKAIRLQHRKLRECVAASLAMRDELEVKLKKEYEEKYKNFWELQTFYDNWYRGSVVTNFPYRVVEVITKLHEILKPHYSDKATDNPLYYRNYFLNNENYRDGYYYQENEQEVNNLIKELRSLTVEERTVDAFYVFELCSRVQVEKSILEHQLQQAEEKMRKAQQQVIKLTASGIIMANELED